MTPAGLVEFLSQNPLMRLLPLRKGAPNTIEGKVCIDHRYAEYPRVRRTIAIKVTIPQDYPRNAPVFEEVGGILPKNGDYHVNPDGTLCLGSPLRILCCLRENSCFNTYYKDFFIPHMYAALLKVDHDLDFVFGELSHGYEGELEDYLSLFKLDHEHHLIGFLGSLSIKKRVANKRVCFCGCGRRLGQCKVHIAINNFRGLQSHKSFLELTDFALKKSLPMLFKAS